MAEKQITSAEFLANLKSKKKALSEAKNAAPVSFLDDAALIELFGLTESSKTVDFQLTKVGFGKNKNNETYARFGFVVQDKRWPGTQLSQMFTIPTDDDKLLSSLKRLMVLLQRFGYDTKSWKEADVLDNLGQALDELAEAKPTGQMSLSVWQKEPTPAQKKKGETNPPRLNQDVIRIYGPGADPDDDDEPEDDDDDQTTNDGADDEPEYSEEPDATWVGLTAEYDGVEVELTKWLARKQMFEVYSASEDQTYVVNPDDLSWPE